MGLSNHQLSWLEQMEVVFVKTAITVYVTTFVMSSFPLPYLPPLYPTEMKINQFCFTLCILLSGYSLYFIML